MRRIGVKSTETGGWNRRLLSFLPRLQRYRLTLDGYGVIALMALVGFAAWHSGTNLLYLLFAMLAAFFLVHGGLVWLCLRRIEAERILPRHVTAMEETSIPITVKNRKWFLDSYGFQIVDYLSSGEVIGSGFITRVPSGGSVHEFYRALFPRRGEHTLKRLQLLTRHPFGLAERGATFTTPQKVLVYPRIVNVEGLAPEINADFGEKETRAKGIGTGLYGLRDYEIGEHARHIHWRSSIKAEKLIVMEYEKEERRRVTLALDNTVSNGAKTNQPMKDEFEKAVVMTASLAARFFDQGCEIALVTGSGRIEYGSGGEHRHRLMRALALIEIIPNGTHKILMPQSDSSPALAIAFRDNQYPGAGRITILDARNWEIEGLRFKRREKA